MKANPRRALLLGITLSLPLVTLFAASCSQRPVEPAPASPPAPEPKPAPIPTPQPLPTPQVDWREAPITPGDWQWSMNDGQSTARFAGGQLVLRCDNPGTTVTILRRGTTTGQVPVTIATSALTRPLSGTAQQKPAPAVAVSLQARDPLLDAMAFSRGRFSVEVTGMPTLYVPSWPEVSRVIEDCR